MARILLAGQGGSIRELLGLPRLGAQAPDQTARATPRSLIQFLKALTRGNSVMATKNVANTLILSVGEKIKLIYACMHVQDTQLVRARRKLTGSHSLNLD